MTDHHIDERLAFIGLDQESKVTLRGLAAFLDRELPSALDDFYKVVRATPETSKFFRSDEHAHGAHAAQLRHWKTIAAATFDTDYARAIQTIGETHARIGLEPRWYIGGYARVLVQLIRALIIESWPKSRFGSGLKNGAEQMGDQISTLLKAALLDMDFAISIYLDAAEAKRLQTEAEASAEQQRIVNTTFGAALQKLAAGDFTYRLAGEVPTQYTALKDNFNTSASQLMETLQSVRASASEIQAGAGEMSRAADDLSRRTEQQAASLEQTASALDQITVTVRHSADSASKARAIVATTREEAEVGGAVVEQAVAAMSGIAASSREVGQIVSVIDEIAFQTNLLALNAGVEAARAGDAGRGFAVVASEVRALAQRSAEAAKEIKSLISNSTTEVDRGVELVSRTGTLLSQILSRVAEIDQSVEAIASSAQEQSHGLGQINLAVNHMDQVTQQNAAMVEESTAASHTLAKEANGLSNLVSRFSVGDEGHGRRARAA